MKKLLPLSYLLFLIAIIGCKEDIKIEDATYFGGEIINPKKSHVLLFKDETLIDSIALDKNNRFLYKFEDFSSGLYHFRHDEYQYVFIEPKDSIIFRLNTIDFDESLTFSGKGAHKNNFIISTFLTNEENERKTHQSYKLPPKDFSNIVDNELDKRLHILQQYKERYEFSDDFTEIAKAHITFHYYAQKERYPKYSRTELDSTFPPNFYQFRKDISLSAPSFGSFYPYYEYIYSLVDNLSQQKKQYPTKQESLFVLYSTKIKVIDSLIQDKPLKNTILKKTALQYLTKIECKHNAEEFVLEFDKYNTDPESKIQIDKLVKTIQHLGRGNYIPDFNVTNLKNETQSIKQVITKPTVIYFWTNRYPQHLKSVHKKAAKFAKESDYNFIGLSIDEYSDNWKTIAQHFNSENEYLLVNHKDALENLLIHNIHKIFVLDENAKILSSELNIFDPKFGDKINALH